jgi:hypothetical protein
LAGGYNNTKTQMFDEKGIMITNCSHDVVLKWVDLYHGERYQYPTLMLQTLLFQTPATDKSKIIVAYDIICQFR